MYRRPKFLEVLLEIRQEMARVADYDVDLFAEMVRSGKGVGGVRSYHLVDAEAKNGSAAPVESSKPKSRKVVKKV